MKPRCKCGRICAYYGKIGGFSVGCIQCNAKHANAKWQRERRAKLWDEAAKIYLANARIERALRRNR